VQSEPLAGRRLDDRITDYETSPFHLPVQPFGERPSNSYRIGQLFPHEPWVYALRIRRLADSLGDDRLLPTSIGVCTARNALAIQILGAWQQLIDF
jgi:hypothetical protein